MNIPIRKMLVAQSKYSVKCPYAMTANYITVHNTANDASANNEISYMIGNNNQVSFHYAVDDKEIVQGIPLERNAWHAGDGANGTGNRKSIGIEICYSKSGGAKFIQAEKNAAAFIAELLSERGWGVEKMKKHQDWSGKYCPHRTLDMGWERFVNMVKAELAALQAPKVEWKDVEKTAREIDGETDLIDLSTGKVVKKVSGKFECAQISADGKYARTDYSKSKNLDYGVALDAFKPLPEAQKEPEAVVVAPAIDTDALAERVAKAAAAAVKEYLAEVAK